MVWTYEKTNLFFWAMMRSDQCSQDKHSNVHNATPTIILFLFSLYKGFSYITDVCTKVPNSKIKAPLICAVFKSQTNHTICFITIFLLEIEVLVVTFIYKKTQFNKQLFVIPQTSTILFSVTFWHFYDFT